MYSVGSCCEYPREEIMSCNMTFGTTCMLKVNAASIAVIAVTSFSSPCMSSTNLPTTRNRSESTACLTSSLPRPTVKDRPQPTTFSQFQQRVTVSSFSLHSGIAGLPLCPRRAASRSRLSSPGLCEGRRNRRCRTKWENGCRTPVSWLCEASWKYRQTYTDLACTSAELTFILYLQLSIHKYFSQEIVNLLLPLWRSPVQWLWSSGAPPTPRSAAHRCRSQKSKGLPRHGAEIAQKTCLNITASSSRTRTWTSASRPRSDRIRQVDKDICDRSETYERWWAREPVRDPHYLSVSSHFF